MDCLKNTWNLTMSAALPILLPFENQTKNPSLLPAFHLSLICAGEATGNGKTEQSSRKNQHRPKTRTMACFAGRRRLSKLSKTKHSPQSVCDRTVITQQQVAQRLSFTSPVRLLFFCAAEWVGTKVNWRAVTISQNEFSLLRSAVASNGQVKHQNTWNCVKDLQMTRWLVIISALPFPVYHHVALLSHSEVALLFIMF